jgi:hypothetical protein
MTDETSTSVAAQDAAQIVDAAITANDAPFDASRFLVNLNGRGQYLEVRFRLLWLRREHPDADITTELVSGGLEENFALFKATVSIPGRGSATGWKQETKADFRDFLEKSETGAIGRALAALGFGTQFCDDHSYGGADLPARFSQGQHAIVDAPVDFGRQAGRGARQPATPTPTRTRPPDSGARPAQENDQGSQRATERQVRFIYAIAREAGLDEQELADWSQELYKQEVDQLNRRDASALIEALQRRRSEVQ